MKVDYSPDAIDRRLRKASELGRMCRSLRHIGPDLLPTAKTQPQDLRGLTLKQWNAFLASHALQEEESESPKAAHAPH
jgi:hypothetical protein